MEEDLQKAVAAGKLAESDAAALRALLPEAFCLHKSWGFGRVAEWNLLLNQVVIDFVAKKGHTMQIEYAATTLQALPAGHILVRKAIEPDAVKAQTKSAPLDLVRNILESLGGKANQDQIAACLMPEIFDAAGFKRWWDSTKKALKKDGHFELPAKRTDPVLLREQAVSRAEELLAVFQSSSQLKDRLAATTEILRSPEAFDKAVEQLTPVIAALEDAALKHQKLQPALAAQCAIACGELASSFPGLQSNSTALLQNLLAGSGGGLSDMLEKLPAASQKAFLRALPDAFGEAWVETAYRLMLRGGSRSSLEIARLLQEQGHGDALVDKLRHWIRERSITSPILCWVAKDRKGTLASLADPGLLGAIFSSLERDQFSEKKSSRLHDIVMEDKELVGDLLAGADRESVRELTRRLLLTPVFDELNKRSLAARIIKLHPEMQTLLTGDADKETKEEALVVSWASLDARKKEYDELVNKKIPQNSKEIQVAREYGDLRENFEFKAAKEMQAVLSRRKAELEHDLGRARGSAFDNPDTTQVSTGTVVTIRNAETGDTEFYTILGAWDGDPEKHIVSYLTAIGQALLGKKIGDRVELPTEHGTRHVEVTAIAACVPPPVPAH